MEVFKRTDLALGQIYPISLVREYYGKSAYDSPLGYGWAFTFDKRLYTYPDGSVLVREGYGKKMKFEHIMHNGTGPLAIVLARIPCDLSGGGDGCVETVIIDEKHTMDGNADGTYTVTTPQGDKDHYDIFGRLAKMEDRNGNSLAFYYELDARSPLWGLLPANVNQNTSLKVAYDYRISRIEEKDASGVFTNQWVLFHYDNATGRLLDIVDGMGRTVSYSHDNIGNLTGVSGPASSAVYGYTDANGSHRMTSINEGSGTYENAYNSAGRITRQTHGNGTIDIEYVSIYAQTRVTTAIKDGAGNTLNTNIRTVDFDDWGRVAKNTDMHGNVTEYQFNYYSDPLGVSYKEHTGTGLELRDSTNYAYQSIFKDDMLMKTEAVGMPLERTTSYTYHPQFNFVTTITEKSIVDPLHNKVTTYTYDDTNGDLLSSAESGRLGDGTPYTYTTAYTYDVNGKVLSVNGPRAGDEDVVSFTYAANGNLLTMTQPLIGTTTFSNHDGLGNPRTVTDPNGNATVYTYDDLGRVTSVKAPGDTNALQITYAASGCSSCGGGFKTRIDVITMPEGNIIDFDYDGFGNLSTIKDGQNNSINYTYDSEGNRLTEQIKDSGNSLQKTLSFTYDELNRLKRVVNPDSSFTEYAYDFRGSRKSAKDPKGNTTNYDYDTLKRLTTVTQPGSIATNFGYTASDNLTTVTDANGNSTTYNYDDRGRVYQVISPDTGTTTYTYDPGGNITGKTDAKGVTIAYQYDAANRLTKIDFPTDTDILYAYDDCLNGKGRLCTMTDASGTTAYEYTPKGQVKKETKTIDSIQYVTQYTYDQNGNMKTMTYPSGKVITYNYANDRATSVLNGATAVATNITYKPFGGMSAITYGNGQTGSLTYDTQYHLATLTTGTFQNLTYGYDNSGNITSIAPGKTYSYDALDRLSTGTGSWGSLGWTYDGVGNRLTENTNTYVYASNTNKLTSANGISFGYDNDGNTTTQNSRSLHLQPEPADEPGDGRGHDGQLHLQRQWSAGEEGCEWSNDRLSLRPERTDHCRVK